MNVTAVLRKGGSIMIAETLLLGVLTVTSYQPIPAQTKPECRGRFHCTTAIDDGITRFGVAVSQDLLESGRVHYGDVLYVPGYGNRIVNDCMGRVRRQGRKILPITNSIDLMVFTKAEERKVGEQKLTIYKLGVTQ